MQLLETLDWFIIAAYFLIIAGIALWTMRKKKDSAQEYFLTAPIAVVFFAGCSINGWTPKDAGLTYGTVTDEHRQESRASWNKWDVVSSVGIILLILAVYIYFSG